MNRSIITSTLVAAALFGSGRATAATFCVTNSSALQIALDLAEVNGQNDTVRIATGFYAAPPGGFVYNAVAPVGGDDLAITISGGWTAFFDNPCGQILNQDPWLTVLDGNDADRVLGIHVRANSSVKVSLLTFANGNSSNGVNERGGGLELESLDPHSARMDVERNVFLNNTADFGGGLHAFSAAVGSGRLYVVNNLFLLNHARSDNGAAEFGLNDGHVYITNNTVLSNTSDGGNPDGGFSVGGTGEFLIANNNLWDNEGTDLNLGTSDVRLRNNNIGVRDGAEPADDFGNISVEPEYESGLFNFTPKRTSPLVDAGTTPPTIGVPPFFWYLSEFDLNYQARVVGPRVDIGAYENERIFANGFDPAGPF